MDLSVWWSTHRYTHWYTYMYTSWYGSTATTIKGGDRRADPGILISMYSLGNWYSPREVQWCLRVGSHQHSPANSTGASAASLYSIWNWLLMQGGKEGEKKLKGMLTLHSKAIRIRFTALPHHQAQHTLTLSNQHSCLFQQHEESPSSMGTNRK